MSLMRVVATITTLFSVLLLSACGSNETCDEPKFYESAALGKQINVPEDLDAPELARELKIPEPSVKPDGPVVGGCVDKPPPIGSK